MRGATEERRFLSLLKDLAVPVGRGRTVPLAQIAEIRYDFEPGVVWRRNRQPAITVRSDLRDGIQGPVVSQQVLAKIADLKAGLPAGYSIETGGAIEDSARGSNSIAAVAPVMVLVMLTALMLQLQSFSRVALVVLTAPLGLIGVAAALLTFNVPFGFVAMLGTIALAGMIMRNSVILVDQIEQDIRGGLRAVGRDHRRDRAPLPPDHAHGGGGDPRDDPAHPQRLLRPDGGGDHGRADGGHRAHPAVSPGALRRVVPHQAGLKRRLSTFAAGSEYISRKQFPDKLATCGNVH